MLAVVQRVARASVRVAEEGGLRTSGEIGHGLVVLLGVGHEDDEADAEWMARKCAELRIFRDDDGKMNRSVLDVGGSVLAVSQFTLFGDCAKGRRPSFIGAAPPEKADPLYQRFVEELRGRGLTVGTGVFQAMMEVDLVNDGPVTLLLDSSEQRKRKGGA
ncbi:MAG: D-tyrosyl-tRNA(Tyr) deacylase [Candidatus Eisenbacteria bacterium]|uniref:D-aminoacyl-tRNA deacylase n=1 Tax=Eiseniibacteriota bacterium TaxID=2212470 RepID=A0A956N7V8_UNCEI|nr:D-tyrosyl-tRNA(Tyr) deacylase [Candidatus Eisenbacteria bacterium]